LLNISYKQPIGIFDSGVGGLTVFKEIRKRFPFEDIIYFGDTARVPYGPKSKNTVSEYSIQNARFLVQNGAKIIIVACNTSSAVALDYLKENLSIPVIGVIEPGAISAVSNSKNKKIGVIGTEGTIRSQAYSKAIFELEKKSEVFSHACPLFVPLVEEGWESHQITKEIIAEYLDPLLKNEIDTLVLGCTHYPILKKSIKEIVGNKVNLIDSAEVIAESLEKILPFAETENKGRETFYVSDNEDKFKKIASRILEKEIAKLIMVKLGESWYVG